MRGITLYRHFVNTSGTGMDLSFNSAQRPLLRVSVQSNCFYSANPYFPGDGRKPKCAASVVGMSGVHIVAVRVIVVVRGTPENDIDLAWDGYIRAVLLDLRGCWPRCCGAAGENPRPARRTQHHRRWYGLICVSFYSFVPLSSG